MITYGCWNSNTSLLQLCKNLLWYSRIQILHSDNSTSPYELLLHHSYLAWTRHQQSFSLFSLQWPLSLEPFPLNDYICNYILSIFSLLTTARTLRTSWLRAWPWTVYTTSSSGTFSAPALGLAYSSSIWLCAWCSWPRCPVSPCCCMYEHSFSNLILDGLNSRQSGRLQASFSK